MKRKKILICCILAAFLTILSIIPIFAYTKVESYTSMTPDDLGTNRGNSNIYFEDLLLKKYYIKVIDFNNAIVSIAYINNNNTLSYANLYTLANTTDKFIFVPNTIGTNYCFVAMPRINIDMPDTPIYIPVYCYNCAPFTTNTSYVEIYNSTTVDEDVLRQEYFNLGYTEGYNIGYDDGFIEGQGIEQYTNLVGYVEQLIGQFTGSSAAQYITPIAIVLVVLFVYFLFIRFLLSLVKAKGIIKTCDIIMIVACIIMLVVMYAPMLDLTIKTEQIYTTQDDTETTTTASEVVRSTKIYVETTETGDIYYGPVGTAIVTKSETIEDIYKISEDIETEAIAYEKD